MYRSYIIAIIIIASFCKCQTKGEPAKKTGEKELEVNGIVLQPEMLKNEIEVVADLLPIQEITLKTQIAGILSEIKVCEGAHVKKGQPIHVVGHPRELVQRNALTAELAIAEKDHERKQILYSKGAATKEELEIMENKITLLEAGIEGLNITIDLANLKAPFAGRLGMIDLSVGAMVSEGEVFTTLTNTDSLKVDFNIPSDYLEDIKINTKVKVVVTKDTLTAQVNALNPFVDQDSRTLEVRALLMPKGNPKFIPGTYATVIIEVGRKEHALMVPTAALTYDIDRQTVFVMKNGRVERKVVQTGAITPEKVEIKEGINFGDTLVTTGLLHLKEGMLVNVNL